MNYRGLVKRLSLPADWEAPTKLTYHDIQAVAITREHLHDDVQGINASLDIIRRTRGGSWPTKQVTEEFNYVDLVWHECEFREGDSFTYALYGRDGPYLGCCYFYPLGRRTSLNEDLLGYDVDVSWWVTTSAYGRGDYAIVYSALRHWVAATFSFWRAYFSNREIPSTAGGDQ